ncbi:MAG TPA: hypothetical protein VK399_04945 [Longimicrobiaceae bacterium]|nr:hypothetical protein [Longimicrobiaceae bacterium]
MGPVEQPSHGLVTDLADDLVVSTTSTVLQTSMPVNVLQRTSPLTRDISVSAEIGKNGGSIEIREAGLRFIVPSNALVPPTRQKTVTITVTALKGDEVAYTFQPHGLQFREPVRIEQEFKGTTAERNRGLLEGVEGAYFPSVSDLDAVGGVASVLEFRPTSVDVTGSRIKFTVDHFSGYLIASGRTLY